MSGGVDAAAAFFDRIVESEWFGFDLDDTLHPFRSASAAAMEEVFAVAAEAGAVLDSMRSRYPAIVGEQASGGFVDGRRSVDYRRERFQRLLGERSATSEALVIRMLDVYEAALERRLAPSEGAVDLLRFIKETLGARVAIVSEGPQDAQAWTIRRLGFEPWIDRLTTSNQEGVHKCEGLFPRVLARVGCPAHRFAYLGDSLVRDYRPAKACGMGAMLLVAAEAQPPPDPDVILVRSLAQIEEALRQSGGSRRDRANR